MIEAAGWRAETLSALVALLCYVNTLPNDYCYDDNAIVRFNKDVNEPGRWLAIWTTDYWSELEVGSPSRDLLYRPVAVTSFRLVRVIAGDSPLYHHLINMLLHGLISVLVVRLCRLVGGSDRASLAAGVFFAVMPIHVEAVAAVVGRADLLATLGIMLALLCHRRLMCASASPQAMLWGAAASLAALGAMGAKESGVCVVMVLPLFDAFWCRRSGPADDRLGSRSHTDDRRSRVGIAHHLHCRGRGWWAVPTLRAAYVLIPLAVYVPLRYHALEGRLHQSAVLTKTVNVLVDAPPWQHALGVVQLWGMYWAKTIYPKILCVSYSINAIRLATDPLDPHVLLGMAVTGLLISASIVAWRKGKRSVALLLTATVITYAPTANAVILIRVFFAERIWYLPSVWVAILAGLAAAELRRSLTFYVVAALIVGGMSVRCWDRAGEWRNNGALHAAAYRDLPDSVCALHLYGQWLAQHGYYEDGVALLGRAIEIDPGYTDAHRSLGAAHLQAKNFVAALRHAQIANMQVPNHPPTIEALKRARGALLAGHQAELEHLRQEADTNPGEVNAQLALVRKLRELALTEQALARLIEHESRFADHAAWQVEHAVALLYLGAWPCRSMPRTRLSRSSLPCSSWSAGAQTT
jgi:hypothetical protein